MSVKTRVNMRQVFFILFFLHTTALCDPFPDWLVTKIPWPSKVIEDSKILTITNGLISKKFLTNPGFGAIDFYSHEKKSKSMRR